MNIEEMMDQEADRPGQHHRDELLRRGSDIIRQCRAAGFIDEKGEVLARRMYWRYDCDEGESPYDDLADMADACDLGDVFRVMVAAPLPDEYHVATVDDKGHSSSRPATKEEVELWKSQREAWRNQAKILPVSAQAAAAKEGQ